MGKRDTIARELERLPEQDLDKVLAFLKSLGEPAVLAANANDWLNPDDDAAWSNTRTKSAGR